MWSTWDCRERKRLTRENKGGGERNDRLNRTNRLANAKFLRTKEYATLPLLPQLPAR